MKSKNKIISLGAIFIATYPILIFLCGGQLSILMILLPIPATVYAIKTNNKLSIAFVIAATLISLFFNFLAALLYVLPATIIGITLGFLLQKKHNQMLIFIIISIMFCLQEVIALYVLSSIANYIIEEEFLLIAKFLKNLFDLDMDIIDIAHKLIPSVMIFFSCLYSLILMQYTIVILRKLNLYPKEELSISKKYINKNFAYITIAFTLASSISVLMAFISSQLLSTLGLVIVSFSLILLLIASFETLTFLFLWYQYRLRSEFIPITIRIIIVMFTLITPISGLYGCYTIICDKKEKILYNLKRR